MPVLTTSIGVDGPIIDIAIGVSAARSAALVRAGKQVPAPAVTRGLVDTGASCTCIDPAIVAYLGLDPTGLCQSYSAASDTHAEICNQYDIALAIFMDERRAHVVSVTIPAIERPLRSHGFDALIGRDVLSRGVLVYNGVAGALTLTL